MDSKYYVAIRPQTNDNHAVHKDGCPFMPDDGKRIYLGEFSSGHRAVEKSLDNFDRSTGCLFCCKETSEKPHVHNYSDKPIALKRLQLPVTHEQSMFCCMN